MKRFTRIHWFLGTLLMMILAFGSAFTAYAGQNTGVIDYADNGTVRGWAWNSADPSVSIEVHVTVTNQASGQIVFEQKTLASEHRPDLASRGTGNYGFQTVIPSDTLDNGTYLAEAYANGSKLSGSRVFGVGEAAKAELSAAAETAAPSNLRSMGVFKTTAYCPCYSCSEGWGRQTSTGATAAADHTIAVDPKVIPYGSKVMINGTVYTAEDRGGGVKNNHIDIFFNTHGETRAWGVRNIEVFLVQ